MRRSVALVAAIALLASPIPLSAAPAARRLQQAPAAGAINGTAQEAAGNPLALVTARLRNIDNGAIVATTQTNSVGSYAFTNLPPGNYVVEVVGVDGKILGTSVAIHLTPAAMTANGVGITATLSGLSGTGGPFITSTLGLITIGGIGLATVGIIIAAKNDASASK